MKPSEFKKLIKESVREAIQEELKDILLEAVRSNKQPITESYRASDNRTLNFNTNSIPHQIPSTPKINPKQAYMDILGEMSQGPKSGFDGEFKVSGPVNTMSEGSALPEGQLGLDQIMGLIKR
tara:strand:- start:669 stop:1037 length:369 start_codon:yes stop_codon:yes gene_type:complete